METKKIIKSIVAKKFQRFDRRRNLYLWQSNMEARIKFVR